METRCVCQIRKIYKVIGAFETRLEELLNLNFNEIMLLCLLSERENLSAGEISEELDLTRSNTSKVIASLEQEGLIRRRVCKEDGRSMRFHLTKKGEERLDHIHCDKLQLPAELQELIKE
jgi:DNA-binding MarR family transcriptional regulator